MLDIMLTGLLVHVQAGVLSEGSEPSAFTTFVEIGKIWLHIHSKKTNVEQDGTMIGNLRIK